MDAFFDGVQAFTERWLTKRKAMKVAKKNKKRTLLSEALEWLDAIVFAVLIVVLLVKPTGLLGKQIQEKV